MLPPKAVADLVALVDAVDELRVGGCPRETDSRRVDRLGLHAPGGDGGHWRGGKKGGRECKDKKKSKGVSAGCLPASILMSVLIAAAQVRAGTAISLFLMTLTPNTEALRGFVCVSCLWISSLCVAGTKGHLMLMQSNIIQL